MSTTGEAALQAQVPFVRVEGDSALILVDLRLYSVSALQRVAHKFTDRCALHLQQETDVLVAVRFRVQRPPLEARDLAEMFLNELLDQTVREQISQESEAVRNLILAHALSETSLLHPELEEVDPTSDPLNIATPDSKNVSPS